MDQSHLDDVEPRQVRRPAFSHRSGCTPFQIFQALSGKAGAAKATVVLPSPNGGLGNEGHHENDGNAISWRVNGVLQLLLSHQTCCDSLFSEPREGS